MGRETRGSLWPENAIGLNGPCRFIIIKASSPGRDGEVRKDFSKPVTDWTLDKQVKVRKGHREEGTAHAKAKRWE